MERWPEYPPEFDDEPLCDRCGKPRDGGVTWWGEGGEADYCSLDCLMNALGYVKLPALQINKTDQGDGWKTNPIYTFSVDGSLMKVTGGFAKVEYIGDRPDPWKEHEQ